MDGTNALLANLVQTKSVERVLAPIAVKLSQLIIINEEFDQGKRTTFPCDADWTASILKATEGFVEVARRLGQNSSDQELHDQMPIACDGLSVAAQNFVTAQQRLAVENYCHEARRHFVRTAKDILEGTIKVFLISDDAEVRKIMKSVNWVMDRLGVLTAVRSIKTLVSSFKVFTESLMLLIKLLDKRQVELVHPKQREALINHMATLRKLVPMLTGALQTYVKYPDNTQAKASRDYVVGSVLDCLHDIEEIVQNKQTSQNQDLEEEDEQPGQFITTVDKIIDKLSEEQLSEDVCDVGGELDLLIESAIRHSMAVAHLTNAHHRSLIVTNSQRAMQQRSLVLQHGKSLRDNQGLTELRRDFVEACDQLATEFTELERHVNSAILHLVVVTYSETTQPMERLVKAALKPIMNRERMPEAESEEILESFISNFHAHSDKMCQIGRFLAASSGEVRRVRVIRSCISLLEKLDPELVPATIACRSDMHNKGAVEHLRLLKKEWTNGTTTLVNCVDDIIDVQDFLTMSDTEVREAVNQCKCSLYSEMTDIAEITRLLIGLLQRITKFAKTAIDKDSDPVHRNTVMVHITQLSKVIQGIKSSVNRILNDMGDLQLHETLHKRADTALSIVGKIRSTLDGEMEEDILSSARIKAKEPGHIMALNEALAECEMDTKVSISRSTSETETASSEIIAMKEFLSELTDTRLIELKRSFVTASVGGNQKQMDILYNDILSWTNHIIEVTKMVAPFSSQNKETLEACSAQLTKLCPRLLDLAHKACLMDVDKVEPLYETADAWAGTLVHLEGLLDGVLHVWTETPFKVVDAAKIRNISLLKAQLHVLESSRRQMAALSSMISSVNDMDNIIVAERMREVQESIDAFDNQTTMLATVADILVNTDNAAEKSQLERSAREWAGLVYSIAGMIDRLATESLVQVKGHAVAEEWSHMTVLKDVIGRLTEDTIRLKDVIIKASHSMKTEDRAQLMTKLDDIDLVVNRMAECADGVTDTRVSSPRTELKFIPLHFRLLQWQWAMKVQQMWLALDEATLDYSLQIGQLFDSSVNVCSVSTVVDPETAVTELKDRVDKSVMRIKEALTPVKDSPKKFTLQSDLVELTDLTQNLVSAVQNQTDTSNDQSHSETQWLGRSWACKAQSLVYSLADISDACSPAIVKEAGSLLKGDQSVKPTAGTVIISGMKTPDLAKVATKKTHQASGGFSVERPSATATATVHPSPNISSTDVDNKAVYKQLLSGPRMQHRKPDPPSAKSGYQPSQRNSISFNTAADCLHQEANRWEDDNNPIVRIAKEMTQHLSNMTEYARGGREGNILNKEDLIGTAKAIAKNGETLVKFAKILAKYCVDTKFSKDLMFYADHVPMVSTQLNILASVKAATPDDRTAEKMLVQNAENLLSAISKMLTAAEATCVKGLRQPPSDAIDETEAIVLAMQWKRKFTRHRWMEKSNASLDELGLRRVERTTPVPALRHIVNH